MQVKIEFRDEGFAGVLQDPRLAALVEQETARIAAAAEANAAGMDYKGEEPEFAADVRQAHVGRSASTRPQGIVGTANLAAMIAEADEKALSKAVGR